MLLSAHVRNRWKEKPPMIEGSNRDPKVALMRKAATAATTDYGIGGRKKTRPRPPVTLPKLKCLEDDEEK